MAFSLVQEKDNLTAAATSLALTLTSTPVNGNFLVAIIAITSGTSSRVSSITQTGATWQRAVQVYNSGNLAGVEIWYAAGVSGASTSITINLAASLAVQAIVEEWSGVSAIASLDQTATATGDDGGGQNPQTGTTGTTIVASELAIGGIAISSTGAITSPTNSFALDYDKTSLPHCAALSRSLTSLGTYSTSCSWSASPPLTYQFAGAMATFKAKVGGDAAGSFGW